MTLKIHFVSTEIHTDKSRIEKGVEKKRKSRIKFVKILQQKKRRKKERIQSWLYNVGERGPKWGTFWKMRPLNCC